MKLSRSFRKTAGYAALMLVPCFYLASRIAPLYGVGAVLVSQQTQTPSKALLVLEKDTLQLDIIDAVSLKVIAKVASGPDPHEVIASADGRTAYISNYQGQQGAHHTLTVVDLVGQKALPNVDLGVLEAPHGLDFAGGMVYFTAEGSKAIGRYDPAARKVDWVMGTGQDRTHMVWVGPSLEKIVTTNVGSGSVSIFELGAPGRGNQSSWVTTVVPVGRGSEGFDVSPDGKEIWTGNAQDNTISVIDFAAKKNIQTIPISVKGANRLKFAPDGKYVLVSGLGAGGPNLVVIDAAMRKEVKQLSLGGGSAGLLMDGSRAFVAVSGGNKVVVVDLNSLSVTSQITPLGQPDGMALAIRR